MECDQVIRMNPVRSDDQQEKRKRECQMLWMILILGDCWSHLCLSERAAEL